MIFTGLPFSLNGKVYRSVMPFGAYDQEGTLIERYQKVGIDIVVVLAEDAELLAQTGRDLIEIYQNIGLDVLHMPIMDFSVPKQEELLSVIEKTIGEVQAGKKTVIHCSAGKGRTGLFVACLAKSVWQWDAQEAIQWTRQQIPGAIETPEQVKFIQAYDPRASSSPPLP